MGLQYANYYHINAEIFVLYIQRCMHLYDSITSKFEDEIICFYTFLLKCCINY